MKIFVEDTFDAAHWLPNVPLDHKCHNLHGHTYRVRLEIEGCVIPRLDWVVDYADVKRIWEPIKAKIDHHCLNEIVGLENSTCERLALWIHSEFLAAMGDMEWRLARLEIRETANAGVVIE